MVYAEITPCFIWLIFLAGFLQVLLRYLVTQSQAKYPVDGEAESELTINEPVGIVCEYVGLVVPLGAGQKQLEDVSSSFDIQYNCHGMTGTGISGAQNGEILQAEGEAL